MFKNEFTMETEARRFLLGELSETERSGFEERFVADENLFEQTRVVEDELIESYVRGTLSAAEKEKFARNFLITDRRRNQVAFTRAMLGKLSEQNQAAVVKKTETAAADPSVWKAIAGFFKTPSLAFGTAFALLILIFGGWFLTRNGGDTEIAQENTPTPNVETTRTIQPNAIENSPANAAVPVDSDRNAPLKIPEKTLADKNVSPNANREIPNKNRNSDARKQNLSRAAPVFALFTGAVRAEGKIAELNLPKDVPGANFQLNLESRDYRKYSVEIVDPDGKSVFVKNNLKARNSKINFFVAAAKLRRGDYIVKLSARNPNNETESVADYAFRINR